MNIRIKKLNKEAVLPCKVHNSDACYDLTAIAMKTVNEKEYNYIEYDTGLSMSIPEGYCGLVFPRSSISKTGLLLRNSVGVIDSGYLGSIKARYHYIGGQDYYKPQDRIAQIMIIPTINIEWEDVGDGELDETERGEGGFGSTGLKNVEKQEESSSTTII